MCLRIVFYVIKHSRFYLLPVGSFNLDKRVVLLWCVLLAAVDRRVYANVRIVCVYEYMYVRMHGCKTYTQTYIRMIAFIFRVCACMYVSHLMPCAGRLF